ncbi:hypothetical protein [Bacterioplanoides sp.]|uniref:hypothetical protein n=1 Tax=Bacterioplanoides sp. TaxID=2066072 RepID=UPI003B008CA3
MKNYKLKLFIILMKENRWGIISFFLATSFYVALAYFSAEERVRVECTVTDKGVSFSETGNIPNVRCKLDNGVTIVVSNKSRHYDIDDVIFVNTRKSNINP